ncbi:MAG: Heme O synthase, protoheme IX farnesyltransferase COX10-CtaB, partial [uncultured Ramlibacter sp.]
EPRGAVLCADQAARGAADRLLRRHRHGPGGTRCAGAGGVEHRRLRGVRHLAGGRSGCRLQLHRRERHRREDEAHGLAANGQGRVVGHADAPVLGGALRRRFLPALHVGESADHVADVRHVRRLCGDLHGGPEAAHAAEHRDWGRFRRDAARARLGRDARRRRSRGADPVPHHLPVDAAALLGARPVPGGGLPQVGAADAADHAWQRVHPPADPAVHAGAVRRVPAALRLWNEFVAVPGGCAGAERGVHLVRLPAVAQLLGCARPQDLPFLPDPPEPAVRGAAAGSLHFM